MTGGSLLWFVCSTQVGISQNSERNQEEGGDFGRVQGALLREWHQGRGVGQIVEYV